MTNNQQSEQEFTKPYELAVSALNCKYADKHGVCSKLSDDEVNEYCPLSPCPDYKEKQ